MTVDYATGNGEAKAGTDFVEASGTLTFAANETSKTVEVEVLADEYDEEAETMTLTLTNPAGARIADDAATGTIENTGAIPKAWIARFGRTVADQVLDAVDARLRAARAGGVSVSVAGQRLGGAAPRADGQAIGAPGPSSSGTPGGQAAPGSVPKSAVPLGAAADAEEMVRLQALGDWLSAETAQDERSLGRSRTLTGQQVLMGSSFSLAAQTDGGGLAAFGGGFTMTPELGFGLSDAGRDYGAGWRLTRTGSGPGSLELSVDATRRESANDDTPPERGVGARFALRW